MMIYIDEEFKICKQKMKRHKCWC